MYLCEKFYVSVSPEDKNDHMIVFRWDSQESSFKDVACAETARLPLVTLSFPTTWNVNVMAGNAASVLSL